MEDAKLIVEEKGRAQMETNSREPVEVSVVVPITEHHDDLRQIYLQCVQGLAANGHSYEFIFVVDGPKYDALQALKELKKEYPELQVITLNCPFGEATALSVGFGRSKGRIILTLSAYFQVELYEIQRMLERLSEDGHDLIISRRYPRLDSVFNRAQSLVFHQLTRMLTGTKYHDISCGLRVMKRKVAEEIHLYGDLHHFFPLLAYQRGFKVAEVPVQQSRHDLKRRVYGPGVYLRRLLDILTIFFLFKFTKKPLRFFGLVGSAVFGAGAIVTGYLGLYRLLNLGPIAGRPLLILGVLLMVLGVQLFSIGFLGEIIIFTHSRKIKEYTIERFLR